AHRRRTLPVVEREASGEVLQATSRQRQALHILRRQRRFRLDLGPREKSRSSSMKCDQEKEVAADVTQPSERQVRLSRATMVEAISRKLTGLFTAIIGHADLALLPAGEAETIARHLEAIKRAAYTAQGWNAKLISLMDECRLETGQSM